MGLILDGQKRLAEAETFFERALELAPGDAYLYSNFGNHYLEQGQAEEARAAYLHAIELDPADRNANSQLAHPPQGGWLDEWGRLKGGHLLVLGVAPGRASVMDSKLPAASIRFFLFADVLANLLQLEPDRGYGVTAGPEMLAREIPLFAAQSGYRYRALPFQKPNDRRHRVLGGNGNAHMHMVWHQMALQNLAFLLPGQGMEDFSQVPPSLTKQYLAPSLGNEHHMVFAVPS